MKVILNKYILPFLAKAYVSVIIVAIIYGGITSCFRPKNDAYYEYMEEVYPDDPDEYCSARGRL